MKTKVNKIPFKEISLLSQTATDYLYHPEKMSEFITYPATIVNFEKALNSRQAINREVLVIELLKQNKKSHKKSLANIELLRNENSFTVTTGHQICVFTGPLYSIYKIISTINLATKLKQSYPTKEFVPVFWMATEDHDFEEINHIYLGEEKVTWNSSQKGPVGRFETQEMDSFLEEINALSQSDLTKKLTEIYRESICLSEAHNKMIDYLFGEYGVVIIDADSRELKREMIPIFTKEITERHSQTAVNELSATLEEKGYKKQVHPREINLFYQEKGMRERIVFEENSYQILNTDLKFSEAEILKELNDSPEKFSPNVVMRPMYQEKILPNLGYIGGPGELAYWLQLKQAFELYQLDFPILVLRNSALLIPESIDGKIEKLPFSLPRYFEDKDSLIKEYLGQNTEIDFEPEIEKIEQLFELTKEKATQIDFTLEKTVIAELKRAQNSMEKIKKKALKAEKTNHSVAVARIEKVKESFFPGGTFQERKSNILEYHQEDLIKNLVHSLISLEDNLTLIHTN